MRHVLTSQAQAVRALSLIRRTSWTRSRRQLFLNLAGRYNGGRSVRWHSTQSETSPVVKSKSERVSVVSTRTRFLNNLNPRSIHPEDYMDLSDRYSMQFSFKEEDNGALKTIRLYGSDLGKGVRRFPEGCKGFFYFYEDPQGRLNISGIRFRIVQEPTQKGFDAGEDFRPIGSTEPWSFSVLRLAGGRQPGYNSIVQHLYNEGLVDPAYVAKWLRIMGDSELFSVRCPMAECLLMSFDEPFEYELSGGYRRLNVLELEQSRIVRILLRAIHPHKGKMPYKGRCLIRLEKLDEKLASNGETCATFNIRVLETLTPIECLIPGYEGVLPPKAGSLLQDSKGPVRKQMMMKSKRNLSPDVVAEKMSSKLEPALPGRQISTLDPERLTPSDHLDFSGKIKVRGIWTSAKVVQTTGVGTQEQVFSVTNKMSLHYCTLDKYADGRKGFLYYHRSHPQNPLSGSIRFRLADQPTIDAFRRGEDLIHPLTKSVWELPLLRLVHFKTFRPLVAQLSQDGLLTQEIIDKCTQLHSTIPSFVGSSVLYELGQPFVMDLRQVSHRVYYVDSDDHRLWFLRRTLKDSINSDFMWTSSPFTGQCLVRLEEVPLDQTSATSSNRIHKQVQIRILEIHEPLGWRDPKMRGNKHYGELPEEGSLLPLKAWAGHPANIAYLVPEETENPNNQELES